jgi:DNA-binding IclR family transcriptional regulator
VVAAVSVSGPIERLTRQPGKRFGARVAAAGDEISAVLSR